MNKNIPKLKDLIETMELLVGIPIGKVIFSSANIDDVFYSLRRNNIDEVIVNKEEIDLILRYFLANCADTNLGVQVMYEGKLDKFLGIKLILEE